MKKSRRFLLSALSGLLLFAAWPVSPLTFLIFVAFVPILWLEQRSTRAIKFFGWSYLTLLIWNVATTWWVCNSTLPGGISAILANSLLMTLPWLGFHKVKKRLGPVLGYSALILFWLSFEYIHLNWELSWPWLTLGNAFAMHPEWVQWYEITGASGGSLWVLVVNLMVFLLLKEKLSHATNRPFGEPVGMRHINTRYLIILAVLLIVPLALSRLLTPTNTGAANPNSTTDGPRPTESGRSAPFPGNISVQTPSNISLTPNIVVVQPNIDPYAKFAPGNQEEELNGLIRLSESQIDLRTALVVWPETAIPEQINEDAIKINPFMAPVWDFLRRHPGVDLLTGVEGYRVFSAENKTPYSFRIPESDKYEDSYNSAALLDSNGAQIYHKSKLVPGVETLPSFLKFMAPLFEKFGGTTGGYAQQEKRTVLLTSNHSYRIAPSVCYESIYGEFMSAYVRGGADLLVIITNDGWWGKTPGYRQHENYGRLRAIETRRWVARSANTGISCFIDPAGEVIDPQPWNKTAVIKYPVPRTNTLTFYVRHGDLISHLAIALTIVLILYWMFLLIFKRRDANG
jgi:apolipoprotein N-acyltransferase